MRVREVILAWIHAGGLVNSWTQHGREQSYSTMCTWVELMIPRDGEMLVATQFMNRLSVPQVIRRMYQIPNNQHLLTSIRKAICAKILALLGLAEVEHDYLSATAHRVAQHCDLPRPIFAQHTRETFEQRQQQEEAFTRQRLNRLEVPDDVVRATLVQVAQQVFAIAQAEVVDVMRKLCCSPSPSEVDRTLSRELVSLARTAMDASLAVAPVAPAVVAPAVVAPAVVAPAVVAPAVVAPAVVAPAVVAPVVVAPAVVAPAVVAPAVVARRGHSGDGEGQMEKRPRRE
jgi:hypothetical protein